MVATRVAAGLAYVQQSRNASFGGTSAPAIGDGAAVPITPVAGAPAAIVQTSAQIGKPAEAPQQVNLTPIGTRDIDITFP